MSLLRDQGFEVGDEVVDFGRQMEHLARGAVIIEIDSKEAPYVFAIRHYDNDRNWCTKHGEAETAGVQEVFHRDAVTFDEHGRLTAINHDYVKPRAPKIVKKEPHEFQPFEQVLVRDDINERWKCNLFSTYEEGQPCPYECALHPWKMCIPFVGNEKLVGKVTE